MRNLFATLVILFFSTCFSAQIKPAAASQPLFKAVDMNGQMINTDDLKGKIVVLNLWFINCQNCVEEIKLLNQIVDQYKDNKDVVFIGLAASKKSDLEKFLVKNPFSYQIVPDASTIILSKFGTPDKNGDIGMPFPMHYVLDRSGNVVVKVQGTKGVEAVKLELAKQFPLKTVVTK